MSDLHDRENTLAAKKLELRDLLADAGKVNQAKRAAASLALVETEIVKIDDQLEKARSAAPAKAAPAAQPSPPVKPIVGSKPVVPVSSGSGE